MWCLPVSDTDCTVTVGSVELKSPIMTASGTAGYGDELAAYFDLSSIGAIVTKSIAAYEWPGNPAPRIHATPLGMINAVGLQGPGVAAWLDHHLPALLRHGATVVCSIWGRSVDDYREAADALAGAPHEVVAVEVNLSCPNTESQGATSGSSPTTLTLAAEVIAATAGCERPRWAKLSANTDRLVDVAAAVRRRRCGSGHPDQHDARHGARRVDAAAGARQRRWRLSGRAIHPIAVRAVHDVHEALPELADRRRRRRRLRMGRGRADARRRAGGAGRHRHLRRPPGVCARPRRACDLGLRGGGLHVCSSSTVYFGRMATPPQLTPEQRTAALAKAAEARAARAEIKARLKMGSMSLRDALASNRPQRRQAQGGLDARVPARRGQGQGAQIMDGHRHRRQPARAGPRCAAAVPTLLEQLG